MLRQSLVAMAAAAPMLACAGAALAEVEVTSGRRTTPISTSSPNGCAADRVITLSALGAVADTLWSSGSIAVSVVATDEVGSQQINVTKSRPRSKLSHVEVGRRLIRTVR